MLLRRVFALAVLGLVLASTGTHGQSQPWFGTWRLNPERSTYPGGAPYSRGTWRIQEAGGAIRMVYDLVGLRGGLTHMEWTGPFDGNAYTLQGPDVPVTYAYTRVDANTLDLEVNIDGVPNVRGRIVLSPDGRTITATTTGRNGRGQTVTTISVYEKR